MFEDLSIEKNKRSPVPRSVDISEVERFVALYPRMLVCHYCAYCGDEGSSRDHVLPVSFLTNTARKNNGVFRIGPQVKSCFGCNKFLMDKFFDSFESRSMAVKDWLTEKTNSTAPKWTQYEILKIKGKLRGHVMEKQRQRADFVRRAKWVFSPGYYQNLEGLLFEPLLDASSPTFHKQYFKFFESAIMGAREMVSKN